MDMHMLTIRPAELLRTRPLQIPVASNVPRPGYDRVAQTLQARSGGPRTGDNPNLSKSTRTPPDVHLNPVGDIVVWDGVGEVVLLPHLWNFDLLTMGNFIVLRTSGSDLGDGKSGDGNRGMAAVLTLDNEFARVEGVSETTYAADALADAL